jgi:hypothetical protein
MWQKRAGRKYPVRKKRFVCVSARVVAVFATDLGKQGGLALLVFKSRQGRKNGLQY